MGERLYRLFDYQKFERTDKLSALIEETEKRYRQNESVTAHQKCNYNL